MRPCDGDGADAGSTMIIAVVVLMIMSTLSLAGLARALSELSFMKHGQQYDTALGLAEQGVADAMYQLEHGVATPHSTYSNGNKSWRYRTTSVSSNEIDIFSVGQVGAAQHGVRARATRSPLYKYALFGMTSLTLDTTQLALNAYSFLTLGSTSDTGAALVGTNGSLSCSGTGSFGEAQYYGLGSPPAWPPTGGWSGSCPNPIRLGQPEQFPPPVAPGGGQTCPEPVLGTVTLTGVLDGANGTPMVCGATSALGATVNKITISGTVSVIRPPFVLYVGKSGDNVALDLSTAVINAGGSAANFVINKTGTGAVTLDPVVPVLGTPAAISFSGVLYAPQSDLVFAGSKWWTGSIVANTIGSAGNPILRLGYDLGLGSQTNLNWIVSRWAEAPAASLNVP